MRGYRELNAELFPGITVLMLFTFLFYSYNLDLFEEIPYYKDRIYLIFKNILRNFYLWSCSLVDTLVYRVT